MKMYQKMLPHGDVGRIINSFVSRRHVDAVEWQRQFRVSLCTSSRHPCSEQIKGAVYLVTTKGIGGRFNHIVLLPDIHRMLALDYTLTHEEMSFWKMGGLPAVWYPQRRIARLLLLYGDIYDETYI